MDDSRVAAREGFPKLAKLEQLEETQITPDHLSNVFVMDENCEFKIRRDYLYILHNIGLQIWAGGGAVLFWLGLPPTQPELPAAGADGSSDLEEGGNIQRVVRSSGPQKIVLQGRMRKT